MSTNTRTGLPFFLVKTSTCTFAARSVRLVLGCQGKSPRRPAAEAETQKTCPAPYEFSEWTPMALKFREHGRLAWPLPVAGRNTVAQVWATWRNGSHGRKFSAAGRGHWPVLRVPIEFFFALTDFHRNGSEATKNKKFLPK